MRTKKLEQYSLVLSVLVPLILVMCVVTPASGESQPRVITDLNTGEESTIGGLPNSARMESSPPAFQPLHIFYPRPDSETNSWARHRKTYPGINYRVGITPAYGRPPYYFDLVEGPPGMTVGSFLVDDGSGAGRIIPNKDYGVVAWANPVATAMPEEGWSVTVRVYDQNSTYIDVSWLLEVGTDNFVFVDPVNGDDENDGTIESPFATSSGWSSTVDGPDTYSGYHVIYRQGVHVLQPAAVTRTTMLHLRRDDQPLVHYGYYGEEVVWDFSDVMIVLNSRSDSSGDVASDFYLAHIILQNNHQENSPRLFWLTEGTGPEEYDGSGGGQRITFHDVLIRDFTADGYDINNNTAFWWSDAAFGDGKVRHYFVMNNVDVENFDLSGNSTGFDTNGNIAYLGSTRYATWWRGEIVRSKARATLVQKAGSTSFFHFFVDAADPANDISFASRNHDFDTEYGYRQDWGYNEWAYCKGSFANPGKTSHASNDPIAGSAEGPDRLTRVTLRNTSNYVLRIGNNAYWPIEVFGNIWVTDDEAGFGNDYSAEARSWTPTTTASPSGWRLFSVDSDPLDFHLNLTSGDAALRGKWGAEVFRRVGGLSN